ncbi:MAG TPA: hypothetical protein VLM89_10930 [Phycisphaerae bacterium]|nr:hypothetical protein [Phycisphaerae bacterium]
MDNCVVTGAFVLLAGGVAISWCKRRWVEHMRRDSAVDTDVSAAAGGASP